MLSVCAHAFLREEAYDYEVGLWCDYCWNEPTTYYCYNDYPHKIITLYSCKYCDGHIHFHPDHFPYDFMLMHKSREWLREELQEYLYHPDRIRKWIEKGNDVLDYLP